MRKVAVVVLLAVVAAAWWILTNRESPYTRTALGAKIVLKSVERKSGDRVEAAILIRMPQGSHRIAAGDTELTGDKAEMDGSTDDDTNTGRLITHTIYFRIAQSAKSVSVAQEVHWDLPYQHAVFSFKNVDPRHLPEKRKFGGAVLTLRRVIENRSLDRNQWLGADQFATGKYYGIVVERKCPRGYVPYRDCTFTDDRGRTPSMLDECDRDRLTCTDWKAQSAAVLRAANGNIKPTTTERVVGTINQNMSDKMRQKRLDQALEKAREATQAPEADIYVFSALSPPPKTFSFTTRATLPARNEDSAWVTFTDVPIPFPAKHATNAHNRAEE